MTYDRSAKARAKFDAIIKIKKTNRIKLEDGFVDLY